MPQWIKATDRLPPIFKSLPIRISYDHYGYAFYGDDKLFDSHVGNLGNGIHPQLKPEQVEWLDDSEPSFGVGSMHKALEAGIHFAHKQQLGDSEYAFFQDFMKINYNVDV